MNKNKQSNLKLYLVFGICSVVFTILFILTMNFLLNNTEYNEPKTTTANTEIHLNDTSTVINKFRVDGMYFLVIDDSKKDMPYNMEVTKEQYDNTEYTIKKEE